MRKQLEAFQKELAKRGVSNTINLHQSKLAGQDHQEQTHTGFSDFAAASVDAFRPTPPGNSPGVGHPKAVVTSSSTTDQHSLTGLRHDYSNLHKSSHNIPGNVQQSMSGKEETSPTSLDVFAAASTDDFRPTSPGYSPGVGHPKAVVTSSSTADQHSFTGVKDYYNNVHKSNHIGVADNVKKPVSGKGEMLPTVTTTSFDASAASTKDDFRPTAPGFSPGVGHPKKVVTSSSTKHSITGFKDDYRPTQPGHSPGVGHSYQKNNAGQDP
ncbi:hypothetical protein RCOM_0601130 [Ricinus communis]|uniref:Uncharacterized protein n=1 Tax=Ricinus communis TaxID=3988 RepID=B9S8I7_RICCO|nr:hypothetical protein RCOM_0601130 [Ricinus communis]